jgi:hypothetical protein
MPSAQHFLNLIEATTKGAKEHVDPCTQWWIDELREIINDQIPELQDITVGGKYEMVDKKGRTITLQVTKENQKTWVMYELEGSARPGCRWMIHKTWCQKSNIWPVSSAALIPRGIKVK